MDIAQALDIPFRDRNALLLAAGYAPLYSEGAKPITEKRLVTARAYQAATISKNKGGP